VNQIPESKRVYVDESGCNQYYGRQYGYAPRGVKIEDIQSGRKFGRTNVIAGYCDGGILAPVSYKGTTTAAFFEDWFEFELLSVYLADIRSLWTTQVSIERRFLER
jgi:hypothetical protein